ncbi:MAG: TIGR03435 family protein [Bryobacteraceae bacterium]
MRVFAMFLFGLAAVAQPLRFEVASVRPSEPVLNQVSVGLTMDRNAVRITSLPLGYYIRIAYDLKASQLIGPPNLQDRFDLAATVPEGVTQDKLPEMLQAMLAERFQLKFHRENRDMQVYALIQGKGPLRLKEVAPTTEEDTALTAGGTGSSQGISVNLGNGASFTFANNRFDGKKLDLKQVVDELEQFVDRPIVDQTNLKGRYDFTLEMTPEDFQTMRARASVNAGFPLPSQIMQRLDTAQFPSLFEAFERLGMKLDGKKVGVSVVVVDGILKAPTEN